MIGMQGRSRQALTIGDHCPRQHAAGVRRSCDFCPLWPGSTATYRSWKCQWWGGLTLWAC